MSEKFEKHIALPPDWFNASELGQVHTLDYDMEKKQAVVDAIGLRRGSVVVFEEGSDQPIDIQPRPDLKRDKDDPWAPGEPRVVPERVAELVKNETHDVDLENIIEHARSANGYDAPGEKINFREFWVINQDQPEESVVFGAKEAVPIFEHILAEQVAKEEHIVNAHELIEKGLEVKKEIIDGKKEIRTVEGELKVVEANSISEDEEIQFEEAA